MIGLFVTTYLYEIFFKGFRLCEGKTSITKFHKNTLITWATCVHSVFHHLPFLEVSLIDSCSQLGLPCLLLLSLYLVVKSGFFSYLIITSYIRVSCAQLGLPHVSHSTLWLVVKSILIQHTIRITT